MSTVLAVGDLLEVVAYSKYVDQLGLNVLHFKVTATAGGITLEDLPDKVYADWSPYYQALIAAGASFAGIGVRRLSPGTKTIQHFSTGAAAPGEAAAPPMAGQVTGLITFLTGAAGKSNYGRAYIPFPSSTLMDNGTGKPDDEYVDNLVDLMNLWDGYSATIGGNTIVFEQRIVSAASPAGKVINQWIAQQKWATQRRRGNYGQPNNVPY